MCDRLHLSGCRLLNSAEACAHCQMKPLSMLSRWVVLQSPLWVLMAMCAFHFARQPKAMQHETGWVSDAVGKGAAGSVVFQTTGEIRLTSSGTDLWNEADSAYMVYRPITTTAELMVRVDTRVGQRGVHGFAKAALAMRAGIKADAPFVALAVTSERPTQSGMRPPTVVQLLRQSRGSVTTFRGADYLRPNGIWSSEEERRQGMSSTHFPKMDGDTVPMVWLRIIVCLKSSKPTAIGFISSAGHAGEALGNWTSMGDVELPRELAMQMASMPSTQALNQSGNLSLGGLTGMPVAALMLTRGPYTRSTQSSSVTFSHFSVSRVPQKQECRG